MTDTLNNYTSNNPPRPEELAVAALEGRLDAAERKLEAIPLPLTADSAPRMRDVMAEATLVLKLSEEERREIQKPHEERLTAIRNWFRKATAKGEEVRDKARAALTAYLEAERIRQDKEAAEAAALARQAELLAAEALAREAGPLETFSPADDAQKAAAEAVVVADYKAGLASAGPAVHSASGMARGASLRTTWGVKVTDPRKLVHAFRDHPEMIELATKLAAAQVRAAKGNLRKPIPGCEPEERRAAV